MTDNTDTFCCRCGQGHKCPMCGREISTFRRFSSWLHDKIMWFDPVEFSLAMVGIGTTVLLVCAGLWVLKDCGVI